MQKLTGTSSGKNNKSCRIIHNGSDKIGFAFVWFFYDFLRNLQESGKSLYYLSYPIARRPSERIVALQCGPWGGRLARLARIEPLRWGIRPGDGWRRKRSSPLADLWLQTSGKTAGEGRPAAPRRPNRGAARSGGAPAQEATQLVLGGWGGLVAQLWCTRRGQLH
jgi:hypothetical protein